MYAKQSNKKKSIIVNEADCIILMLFLLNSYICVLTPRKQKISMYLYNTTKYLINILFLYKADHNQHGLINIDIRITDGIRYYFWRV